MRSTVVQDERYALAAEEHGAALRRLVGGYERDPELRADLLQDIHAALWVSLGRFDGRCSLRTWVYRVAHNVAVSHVQRGIRRGPQLLDLEQAANACSSDDLEQAIGNTRALDRLLELIHKLRSPDRQIMLLYLEDVDAAGISEITGISPGAVATKIHRLKAVLASNFREGGRSAA